MFFAADRSTKNANHREYRAQFICTAPQRTNCNSESDYSHLTRFSIPCTYFLVSTWRLDAPTQNQWLSDSPVSSHISPRLDIGVFILSTCLVEMAGNSMILYWIIGFKEEIEEREQEE